MKLKSIFSYEKKTSKSFFELSKKFENQDFTLTDLLEMVWISKMDGNPDLSFEASIDPEMELEAALAEVNEALKKKE